MKAASTPSTTSRWCRRCCASSRTPNSSRILAAMHDGVYEKTTKAAIENFQAEQKLLPPAGKDGKTLLAIGGPTIQKLNAMLPATHRELWIIAATKTVFLVPPDADATKGHGICDGPERHGAGLSGQAPPASSNRSTRT